MNLTETIVSIIIPAYGQGRSIRSLLDKLRAQTYPVQWMEVIVVVNSFSDYAVKVLQEYEAPYQLNICESPENDSALAKNRGASLATGSILVFLSEDVSITDRFVEAHVHSLRNRKETVGIGYISFLTTGKPNYYQLEQIALLEEGFQRMSIPGYRFSFKDLSSCNFSISADLFKRAHGFVPGLDFRDDDEFGIRLIKLGASFTFVKNAWSVDGHKIVDIHSALKRRMDEGRIDVRLCSIHPDAIRTAMQDGKMNGRYFSLLGKNRLPLFPFLAVFDLVASCLKYVLFLLEKFKLRGKWKALYHFLLRYWYVRGCLDEISSKGNWYQYFSALPEDKTVHEDLEIDLRSGMNAAAQLLDEWRPYTVRIRYGIQNIGVIPYAAGFERIRGNHLKQFLATAVQESLMASVALDDILNNDRKKDEMIS